METVLKAIGDWLKSLLTAGIMSNLSGLFDAVNEQVGDIAQQVGTRPSAFEPRVFAMIESLSRNVVLPIAGIILTFIACYELIEMITQHNNMAQFEPALIMRWVFKTAISVWFISNTFDIVMAVFDLTQKVVADSSGIIAGNTRVNDIGLSMLEASLMQMEVGPLFGLFLQSFFIGITMRILSIVIFVIVYGRMIEIYCMVSLAPIPMATWGNHEQRHVGQNYLEMSVCIGLSGLSYPHLRGDLCCADSEYCHFRRCHWLNLEHCRLHRPALFQPVQNQLCDKICPRRTLRRCFLGGVYLSPPRFNQS